MSEKSPRKRYRLDPVRDKYTKAFWGLEIEGDWVQIVKMDPPNPPRLVAEFHERESQAYFLPVSFWGNRSYFGLVLDGKDIEVELSPGGKKAIWRLLERAYVQTTPEAAARTLLSGFVQTLLGFGLALLALVATSISNDAAKAGKQDGFTIWWGGILMGGIWGCWGLLQMAKFPGLSRTAQRVKREAEKSEKPAKSEEPVKSEEAAPRVDDPSRGLGEWP